MALDSLITPVNLLCRYLLCGLLVANVYLITAPQLRKVTGNEDGPTPQDVFDCIILWPTVIWLSIEGFLKTVYNKLKSRKPQP